jgi:hypothetical protein
LIGKLIGQRSTIELVGVFIVLPVLAGGILIAVVLRNAAVNAKGFTLADWLGQVVCTGLLSWV